MAVFNWDTSKAGDSLHLSTRSFVSALLFPEMYFYAVYLFLMRGKQKEFCS